jgi:hypothetical protein
MCHEVAQRDDLMIDGFGAERQPSDVEPTIDPRLHWRPIRWRRLASPRRRSGELADLAAMVQQQLQQPRIDPPTSLERCNPGGAEHPDVVLLVEPFDGREQLGDVVGSQVVRRANAGVKRDPRQRPAYRSDQAYRARSYLFYLALTDRVLLDYAWLFAIGDLAIGPVADPLGIAAASRRTVDQLARAEAQQANPQALASGR